MKKSLSFISILFFSLTFSYSQKKLSDIPDTSKYSEPDSSVEVIQVPGEVEVQIPDELIITDEVPICFNGIWEGSDRYIMFQEKSDLQQIVSPDIQLSHDNYIWIYLKIFYGWYLDRAAEKTNRKNTEYPYDINDTVFRDIQNIKIQFKPLINSPRCSAYEMIVQYPRIKEPVVIPVCVIENKLYLNFAIKTNELPEDENNDIQEKNPLNGSWSSVGKVSGILVSKPIVSDNLISTYITKDSIYYIRYWKTNMPYSSEMAFFSDGKYKYEVPKHINSAGNIYTCVTGRSVTIRNVERKNLPLTDYIMNDEQNVIAFGEPYMIKIQETCSLQNMMEIVKVSNARKAPPEDPPFPPAELDWHLEDIKNLEMGNQIIQAVRKRQREFYEKYKLGLHY
ncbi:MAG: hypothetical protein MJ184_01535 [Treponema sp.]|uniref:hypothetical protein n=1 Tax=Treponema sp. TaxID=166 RepID=UPI00298EB2A7|nr:hypothetical protein [Treponema sp.]MCQ2600028.1 hypothetical protein [Treponema sp.]